MNKLNLLGSGRDQLIELAVSLGQPAYRGKQIYRHLYKRRARGFEAMSDLPAELRALLEESYCIDFPKTAQRAESADGTVKFLFQLHDGRFVESVYIPEERRKTLCISSQVGCDVGCTFCLTAQMGFQRNLQPGEIVAQVLSVIDSGLLPETGFNVVYMGMGEPLYNYRNVMRSVEILTDEEGVGLSPRRITISTSGVAPVLEKMGNESVLPNLAISLNAVYDGLRDQIMPLNKKWNLQRLLDACRSFPLEPRRRITFEYVLLAGVNDSPAEAHRLAQLLEGMQVKVNLIPYNPNPGLPFRRPSAEGVEQFRSILTERFVSAFVRRPRGDDISAACGQLAYLEKSVQGV